MDACWYGRVQPEETWRNWVKVTPGNTDGLWPDAIPEGAEVEIRIKYLSPYWSLVEGVWP